VQLCVFCFFNMMVWSNPCFCVFFCGLSSSRFRWSGLGVGGSLYSSPARMFYIWKACTLPAERSLWPQLIHLVCILTYLSFTNYSIILCRDWNRLSDVLTVVFYPLLLLPTTSSLKCWMIAVFNSLFLVLVQISCLILEIVQISIVFLQLLILFSKEVNRSNACHYCFHRSFQRCPVEGGGTKLSAYWK